MRDNLPAKRGALRPLGLLAAGSLAGLLGVAWATPQETLPSLRGVVVRQVVPSGRAAQVDLRVGDVLLEWRRTEGVDPGESAFRSPFDLRQVEAEQGPRGRVTITGHRGGNPFTVELTPGVWGFEVRPQLAVAEAAGLEQARRQAEGGEAGQGAELLLQLSQWDADPVRSLWLLLETIELLGLGLGDEDLAVLFAQAMEAASRADDRSVYAWVHTAHGSVLRARSRFQAAASSHRQAFKHRWGASGERLLAASSISQLGSVAWMQGDLDRAESLYNRALTIQNRLAPDSLDVAHSLSNLGVVASDHGELDGAEILYRRALAIRERLAPGGLDVARNLNNLGQLLSERGDLRAAESLYRRSVEIKEKLAPDSLTLASSLGNLATLLFIMRQ